MWYYIVSSSMITTIITEEDRDLIFDEFVAFSMYNLEDNNKNLQNVSIWRMSYHVFLLTTLLTPFDNSSWRNYCSLPFENCNLRTNSVGFPGKSISLNFFKPKFSDINLLSSKLKRQEQNLNMCRDNTFEKNQQSWMFFSITHVFCIQKKDYWKFFLHKFMHWNTKWKFHIKQCVCK